MSEEKHRSSDLLTEQPGSHADSLLRLQRQIRKAAEATLFAFLGGTIVGPLALGALCDLLRLAPERGHPPSGWLALLGFVTVTGTAFGASALYRRAQVARFRKRLRGLTRAEREAVLRPLVRERDPHIAQLAGPLLREATMRKEAVPAARPVARGDETTSAE